MKRVEPSLKSAGRSAFEITGVLVVAAAFLLRGQPTGSSPSMALAPEASGLQSLPAAPKWRTLNEGELRLAECRQPDETTAYQIGLAADTPSISLERHLSR
jgi:hypothetical protein